MRFKRISNKRVFRIYLERKKELEYYVMESLAYIYGIGDSKVLAVEINNKVGKR